MEIVDDQNWGGERMRRSLWRIRERNKLIVTKVEGRDERRSSKSQGEKNLEM